MIHPFKPKLHVQFEGDGFLVKTAETQSEFINVLKLRHEIFIREWQGREKESGLDLEPFDYSGDHLLIIRKVDQMLVGTYRLLCSNFVESFYSQDEFQMDQFLKSEGIKLELGRACIHHEFRNGITIDLLWKGLARYISASKADYLFGCSSVKTVDHVVFEALYFELSKKHQWLHEFDICSTSKYKFETFKFNNKSESADGKKLRELLPPLLRSYLQAGAAVYGEPAHDKVFSCVDLLTILDLKKLNRRFRERFFNSI